MELVLAMIIAFTAVVFSIWLGNYADRKSRNKLNSKMEESSEEKTGRTF